jgi:hypothetical protein
MHRQAWTTINAVPATLVVALGAWLVWGPFSMGVSLAVGCGLLLFLLWRGSTIGTIWAWSTLLLGVESLAWPVTTMVRFRSSADQPNDEEMGIILNAVLFGLFSSVFWIAFAFGLFRREQRGNEPSSQGDGPASGTRKPASRRRARS